MQAQECCEGGSLRALIDSAAASWHPSGKRLYSYTDALRWCTQVWAHSWSVQQTDCGSATACVAALSRLYGAHQGPGGRTSGNGTLFVRKESAVPWRSCVGCTQVAEALHALHTSDPQIIHRDLKTENLMLTEAGRAGDIRVMDFGLAKLRSMLRSLTPLLCM